MKKFIKENAVNIYMAATALGVILRFVVMSFGHNFDFQSYILVGDLMVNNLDVYANTERYNYGPIFMFFEKYFYLSTTLVDDFWSTTLMRVLFVSLLTMTDIGIMAWLEKHYGRLTAIIFFLNPVSIIITGYHNQFDNMAILLMLLAIGFYNENEKIGWKDMGFILFMALSLTMKHIFFIFPMWLLFSKKLPLIKRGLYAFVPPILFLLSFVPFIIKDPANLTGIINNVFLYRSTSNAPLLRKLVYAPLNVPAPLYTVIFILLVCIVGYLIREQDIEYRTLMYLMSLVAFASAISNQYFAIPMAALCIFSKKIKYVYMVLIGYFLLWNDSGLARAELYPESIRIRDAGYWSCFIGCLILTIVIVCEIRKVYISKKAN